MKTAEDARCAVESAQREVVDACKANKPLAVVVALACRSDALTMRLLYAGPDGVRRMLKVETDRIGVNL